MEKYPSLKFVQSSAHYYKWIEERYPELFGKIKEKIREGKWEPVVPWVEFDANMPSGESLIRQILYSKRYFKEKFGVDVNVLWLPDTFGFNIMLPQIASSADIKYFLTQKLRWNNMVKFPYNFFWWRSPDGSNILVHQTFGDYVGTIKDKDVEEN